MEGDISPMKRGVFHVQTGHPLLVIHIVLYIVRRLVLAMLQG